MPLSPKDKKIKDAKFDDVSSKIADKLAARDRLIAAQSAEIQKLQDEIDELTVIQNALASLK